MPGLFGILPKRPIGDDRLRAIGLRMADALRTVPWLRSEIWTHAGYCGGRVHLGVLNPGAQPLRSHEGLRVWFDGEVYPASGDPGRTPSADEAAAWLSGEGEELARVDGVFAAARFDPATRELRLANDRLGFRPLYWTETAEWFAYASEVKALLAILDGVPAPDRVALGQFFGLDYLCGERTLWEGIRLLPPASLWRISAERRSTHQYWGFGAIRLDPRPEPEVREELARLWRLAIAQRRKPGTTRLLLSGGLDSRMVLAELLRQGADVEAVTFGAPGSADMRIAAQAARAAGVPHLRAELDALNWWHGREEAIWQVDGMVNAIHLHVASIRDHLRGGNRHTFKHLSANALLGGSAIRQQSMGDWPRGLEWEVARRYKENPLFEREDLLAPTVADCEVARCGPNVNVLPLTQGQRRWILNGALALQAHCEVVNPAVGIGILQLVLGGMTETQLMGGRFYERFLLQEYPQYFRSIPWQKTGRGLDESLHVRAVRSGRERLRRVLRRAPRSRRFFDYDAVVWGSAPIRRLLDGPLLLDEWLDGAAGRFLRGGPTPAGRTEPWRARPAMAVLTLETYLRQVEGLPGYRRLSEPASSAAATAPHLARAPEDATATVGGVGDPARRESG